ncbi:MAG: TMEM175 family protein [Polyangiaceae bacterium]
MQIRPEPREQVEELGSLCARKVRERLLFHPAQCARDPRPKPCARWRQVYGDLASVGRMLLTNHHPGRGHSLERADDGGALYADRLRNFSWRLAVSLPQLLEDEVLACVNAMSLERDLHRPLERSRDACHRLGEGRRGVLFRPVGAHGRGLQPRPGEITKGRTARPGRGRPWDGLHSAAAMDRSDKKELGFERFIFFSDAIVAIAITLLALELKLDVAADHHVTFHDLLEPWPKYLAFILSFINIAGFWRTHHMSFSYIRKIDERLLLVNLTWLFFIVIVPFTTSLLSPHFTDTPTIFLYCANMFVLCILQNVIWDYAASRGPDFVDSTKVGEPVMSRMRVMFNLEMLNGLIAVVVSFFAPVAAFVLLFFKLPLFLFVSFYIVAQRKKELAGGGGSTHHRS